MKTHAVNFDRAKPWVPEVGTPAYIAEASLAAQLRAIDARRKVRLDMLDLLTRQRLELETRCARLKEEVDLDQAQVEQLDDVIDRVVDKAVNRS